MRGRNPQIELDICPALVFKHIGMGWFNYAIPLPFCCRWWWGNFGTWGWHPQWLVLLQIERNITKKKERKIRRRLSTVFSLVAYGSHLIGRVDVLHTVYIALIVRLIGRGCFPRLLGLGKACARRSLFFCFILVLVFYSVDGVMDEAALRASSFSLLFLKWVRQPRRVGGKEDDDRDPRNKNISTSNLEFTSPRDFVFVFFDVTSALRTVFFPQVVALLLMEEMVFYLSRWHRLVVCVCRSIVARGFCPIFASPSLWS